MVRLPVKLPAGIPPHLVNEHDGSSRNLQSEATTLHLSPSQMSSRHLAPSLYLDNQRLIISLDPGEVEYSLKNAGTDPVVRLDAKTGTVTALHVGHALIKTRYAGAESETCIVVAQDLTEGDSSNCQELRDTGPSRRP